MSEEIVGADMAGARFRDSNFTGARLVDCLLVDADLSGLIGGLRVNGVEVAPLIEAELDRRHPERVALRAQDPEGLRAAWDIVQSAWSGTIEMAQSLTEAQRQQRVDGEWSLVETLRHLVFVTDAWFGRCVLDRAHPYHPLGLAPTFLDGAPFGLDATATPSFADVLAVRAGRTAEVVSFLAAVGERELDAPRHRRDAAGYPPASEHTIASCVGVVLDEEWHHHQYAVRDLASITA